MLLPTTNGFGHSCTAPNGSMTSSRNYDAGAACHIYPDAGHDVAWLLDKPAERDTRIAEVAVLPVVVETYLKDLKGSLGRDTERARSLVAKLIGQVTLRRDGSRVVAELRGNLPAPLELDNKLYNRGAGRGILRLPSRPRIYGVIA